MSKGGKTGTKRARPSGGRGATQRESVRRRQRRQNRMRQITIIFGGLIGVAVLLVALAQSIGPSQANAVPTPTATTAPTPTPIPQQVSVSVSDATMTASLTTFKTGTPYHFVLKNAGQSAHQFVIAPPVTSSTTAAQLQKETLVNIPANNFAPGATVSFDIVFPTPVTRGQLQLASLPSGDQTLEYLLPITVVKG